MHVFDATIQRVWYMVMFLPFALFSLLLCIDFIDSVLSYKRGLALLTFWFFCVRFVLNILSVLSIKKINVPLKPC